VILPPLVSPGLLIPPPPSLGQKATAEKDSSLFCRYVSDEKNEFYKTDTKGTHFTLLLMSFAYSLLALVTNTLSMGQLNQYPYNLLLYSLHYLGISFIIFVPAMIQFGRNSKMRKSLMTEAELLFEYYFL